MGALDAIRERQQQHDTLPGERYTDSGYISGENITKGHAVEEDLVGPIRDTVTAQSKLGGFAHSDFQIEFAAKQVICPNGENTLIVKSGKQAYFNACSCSALRAVFLDRETYFSVAASE